MLISIVDMHNKKYTVADMVGYSLACYSGF